MYNTTGKCKQLDIWSHVKQSDLIRYDYMEPRTQYFDQIGYMEQENNKQCQQLKQNKNNNKTVEWLRSIEYC